MVWGTGLWTRYRADVFFRTKWNVVAIQTTYILFVLLLFWMTLQNVHLKITQTLLTGIPIALENPGLELADVIPKLIADAKLDGLSFLLLSLFVATVGVGFLVAHMTLRPTRIALNMQKMFIGNVAHELRTPLSVLKTNTEVALIAEDMTPRMQQILSENVEELDRISQILNNLLSFNALFRPEKMDISSVDLAQVADSALSALIPLAQNRGVGVDMVRHAGHLVQGNAVALEQMVLNLLKNAIMYSSKHTGAVVRVTVGPQEKGFVILKVSDKGIGIARKELDHILEPFYRVDKARARSQGASGLGLTIVHEIVKLHQGRISIESFPGEGTNVTVRIPAATSKEAPEKDHTQPHLTRLDPGEIRYQQ